MAELGLSSEEMLELMKRLKKQGAETFEAKTPKTPKYVREIFSKNTHILIEDDL